MRYRDITFNHYRDLAPRIGLNPANIRDVQVSPDKSPTFALDAEFVTYHHTGPGTTTVAGSIAYGVKLLSSTGNITHVHYNEFTARGGVHLVGRTYLASWNSGWNNSIPFDRVRHGGMTWRDWSNRPPSTNNVSPARSARASIGHCVDVNGSSDQLIGAQFDMFCGVAAMRLFLLGWEQGKTCHHRTLTSRKIDIHAGVDNSTLDKRIWDRIEYYLTILRGPVIPPVPPDPPVIIVPELPHREVTEDMLIEYKDVPFKPTNLQGSGAQSAPGALGVGGSVVSVMPRTGHKGPHPLDVPAPMQLWLNNDPVKGQLVAVLPNWQGSMNCDVVVLR